MTQGAGDAADRAALAGLAVWRHPRPCAAAGRCVGRIDLPVDPRRVRRLAGRIRRAARREGRPAVVITSPLQRCRAVGRCLGRLGWIHRVDGDLVEADFGRWDGQPWDAIGVDAVDAWVADFADHRPGGGESVREVLARCRRFLSSGPPQGASVVSHGGWCSALQWLASDRGAAGEMPTADTWPPAIAYGRRLLGALNPGRIPGCG
jgi:alpha-ribazole phosphatase